GQGEGLLRQVSLARPQPGLQVRIGLSTFFLVRPPIQGAAQAILNLGLQVVVPPGLVVPVHPWCSCRTCYRESWVAAPGTSGVPDFGFCWGRTILHPSLLGLARGSFARHGAYFLVVREWHPVLS